MADCETVRNLPLLIQYNNLPLLPFSHPHWAVREESSPIKAFSVLRAMSCSLIGLMLSVKKSSGLLHNHSGIRKHFLPNLPLR